MGTLGIKSLARGISDNIISLYLCLFFKTLLLYIFCISVLMKIVVYFYSPVMAWTFYYLVSLSPVEWITDYHKR